METRATYSDLRHSKIVAASLLPTHPMRLAPILNRRGSDCRQYLTVYWASTTPRCRSLMKNSSPGLSAADTIRPIPLAEISSTRAGTNFHSSCVADAQGRIVTVFRDGKRGSIRRSSTALLSDSAPCSPFVFIKESSSAGKQAVRTLMKKASAVNGQLLNCAGHRVLLRMPNNGRCRD